MTDEEYIDIGNFLVLQEIKVRGVDYNRRFITNWFILSEVYCRYYLHIYYLHLTKTIDTGIYKIYYNFYDLQST